MAKTRGSPSVVFSMTGGAMVSMIVRTLSPNHRQEPQHQKKGVGLHFVPQRLKSFAPEHPSPALHGPISQTIFWSNPGFITPNHPSVIGSSQPHLNPSNA